MESFGLFSIDYEKVITPGEFSVEVNNNHIKAFSKNYSLKNLSNVDVTEIQVIRHA